MNFGADSSVANGISHGDEVIDVSHFDGAFALEVDDHGALLCLLWGVVAYLDEGLDDVVEGVDLIVEDYQIMTVFDAGGDFL